MIYSPTNRLKAKKSIYYNVCLSEIYTYEPDYIENAILQYDDFAIDIEAFKKLPTPTPVYFFKKGYETGLLNIHSRVTRQSSNKVDILNEIIPDFIDRLPDCDKYFFALTYKYNLRENEQIQNWLAEAERLTAQSRPIPPYPRVKSCNINLPRGSDLLSLVKDYEIRYKYKPPVCLFHFSEETIKLNGRKIWISNMLSKREAHTYGSRQEEQEANRYWIEFYLDSRALDQL